MKVKDVALAARQVKAGPADGLNEGEFTAYASVFGNKDSYGDIVVQGAFANTLAEWKDSGNPIPLLFGHNMSDPDFNIGHLTAAAEDDHGLLVSGQLDLENPKAAQVYRMLKGKRVNQMSYAYDVIEGGETTTDGDYSYELRELKLYEVSIVTIGANQDTEILAVKSAADALRVKAGRALSAKNEDAIKSVQTQLSEASKALGEVLSSVDQDDDQEKASGTPEAKSGDDDEEPTAAKSSEPDEEPKANPSVENLAAMTNTYAAAYCGGEGSLR